MKSFKKAFLKLSNKGMSLVELICSIAILAVIGATVSGVLIVSANSYNRGNSETKVQQEAQLVANQIDDLLIDATADVEFDGTKLTIKQGTDSYVVTHNGDKLEYQEIIGGVSSDVQVMASGVTTFDVDIADFAETGYVRLKMDFVRNSQTYPAVFTMTARNKDTTKATEILASIQLPNEILLEPNMTHDFSPAVSGLTNASLRWEVLGNLDSETKLTKTATSGGESNTLKIGKNETADSLRVRVYSVETGPTGAPRAQKLVNVYVRRVDDVNVTGTLISGVALKNGAVYDLEAVPVGSHLLQVPGADYDADYATTTPYNFDWSVVKGSVSLIPYPSDPTRMKAVLTADVPEGSSVKVKATAKHPAGVNKSGQPYADDVHDFWELEKASEYIIPSNGWLRQSNKAQGEIVPQKIQALRDTLGGSNWAIQVRVRQHVGNWPEENNWPDPEGNTEWKSNRYGGDGDGSNAINLRPLFMGLMDYDKAYDVEIKLMVVDAAGNALPMPATMDRTSYVKQEVMQRVQLFFKSDANMLNFTNAVKNDEASAPTIHVNQGEGLTLMELAGAVGVDLEGNSVSNSIAYILEKKQADGTWQVYYPGNPGENIQTGSTCRITFRQSDFRGNYRVKVYVKNQPNKTFAADGVTLIDDNPPQIDYVLYNEESGESIYYFNIG